MKRAFNDLKNKLYFSRLNLLHNSGINKGLIRPFEDEMYESLEDVVYAGTPANIYLKYQQPMMGPGKCYDRSYVISMAFKDCLLASGKHKDLELKYGSGHAGHCWVEKDGWCYDPTHMLKFKQELYYQMFQPTDVKKSPRCDLEKDEFYQQCLSGHFERMSLICTIPLLEEIAKLSNNQDYIKEIERYKVKVNYDYETIREELYSAVESIEVKK